MPRSVIDPTPGERDRLYSVTELAREFGVTARAIRFYEGKSLLAPGRIGANRAYTNKDRARLVLILRGKRLGFSLRDIASFLSLYDRNGVEQMEMLGRKIAERVADLEHQREVLDATLVDLARLAEAIRREPAQDPVREEEGHKPSRDAA